MIIVVIASWRNNASTQLQQTVNELGKQNRSINLADKSIEKFFSLENTFRLYTATGQERFRTQYTSGLIDLKKMLDSLQRSTRIYQADKSTLQDLLKKKDVETNMFLHLKSINVSLLLATADLKKIKPISNAKYKPLTTEEAKIFIDKTIVVQEQKSQRKLFGRIKDAIINKTPNQISTVTTLNKVQGSALESDQSLKALNELLKSSIDELTFNFQQLSENERRLILNNDRLLIRLSNILKEFKGLQIELQNLRQKGLNIDAKVSIIELSNISRLILLISLILALVILYNAWELYNHDKKLLAAKNEAVQTHIRGDFLSHMSHEIRTPLNSILGFSEQLENSVLDLSKFETGNLNLHMSNFYPEKTIKRVVLSLQVLAVKKNIRLSCKCEMDNELRIAGDEYRLKQVLINLINNAIKFTDAGEVVVTANIDVQNLLVEITDNGRGIAREHLNGIFDEFKQIAKTHDNEKQNGSDSRG